MPSIDEIIDQRIGEVRTEGLDISFGEIVNLHTDKELTIQPEYQRLFRWSFEQRSRLIESILLELPIPEVYVIENDDGTYELIDGLQRVCSVIHFMNPTILGLEPLKLTGCDLVPELNELSFEDLPLKLKLQIKRSTVRTIVIKRQSKSMLRYEMFKRLNTGGTSLSAQELRNCTARMIGDQGIEFYEFIKELAQFPSFKNCIDTLPQSEEEKKGDEELVLRFLAAKNAQAIFKGSVRDWLDLYMEKIILGEIAFDKEAEQQIFCDLFTYIERVIGDSAFVKYRNGLPIGGLAPAYFEAVTIGILTVKNQISAVNDNLVKQKIKETLENGIFRSFTGPAANTKLKLESRISTISDALLGLI